MRWLTAHLHAVYPIQRSDSMFITQFMQCLVGAEAWGHADRVKHHAGSPEAFAPIKGTAGSLRDGARGQTS